MKKVEYDINYDRNLAYKCRAKIFELELVREDAWNSYRLSVKNRDKARDNLSESDAIAETKNWHNYEAACRDVQAKRSEATAASKFVTNATRANNVAWEIYVNNDDEVLPEEVN